MIAFRCDGDGEIGAGHVARCLRIALAFEASGTPTVFVGTYAGIAGGLLAAADVSTSPPEPTRPLGAPRESQAIVVDSYVIGPSDIESASRDMPVAVIVDDGPAPAAAAAVSYHLDAKRRIRVAQGTRQILGADYAPVSAASIRGRRSRELHTALVTAGGSETGRTLAAETARRLLDLGPALEIFVAAPGEPPVRDERLAWRIEAGGLAERIAWADIAVSAAGSTPYDLACAGVPMAVRAVAHNQEPIADAFVEAGLAVADPADLLDRTTRARLAAAGPRSVDGYGSFRTRDALVAAFAGGEPPPILRYRPASQDDASVLLHWRNDPHVREMSRVSDPIAPESHAEWLAETLADADRTLLVAERSGTAVGTVRFDRTGSRAEISVTVATEARGGGLGAKMIGEATELQLAAYPLLRDVLAETQRRNLPSLRAFERSGYVPAAGEPGADSVLLVRGRSPRDRQAPEQEHT